MFPRPMFHTHVASNNSYTYLLMFFRSVLHCGAASDILPPQTFPYKNPLRTTFSSDFFSLSFLNQFIICIRIVLDC
ncbi:hypothetical protein I7I48_03377 [Histoplasma ohiense]|nr:hypothetical protein I7I48_03377 [Histoplasma ohiense (nom. inval.)]